MKYNRNYNRRKNVGYKETNRYPKNNICNLENRKFQIKWLVSVIHKFILSQIKKREQSDLCSKFPTFFFLKISNKKNCSSEVMSSNFISFQANRTQTGQRLCQYCFLSSMSPYPTFLEKNRTLPPMRYENILEHPTEKKADNESK